jgi:geranylgeranyl pyrophosphate synthase
MTLPALSIDPQTTLLDLLDRELDLHHHEHFVGPNGETAPFRLWDAALYGPLREFLGRPGKELRARLVEIGFQLGDSSGAMPEELPLIVEMLHAGSLIIDDIEDESGYRRGAEALHWLVGLPRALNAGNWLYFWPEVLVERLDLEPAVELELRRRFSRTMLRCHNGQALDLSVRVTELDRSEVVDVVMASTSLKTGSLVELALVSGGVSAGAAQGRIRAVAALGRSIGVGLQMLDDLSGIISERRRHKGHEDLIHARPTWPWAWTARETDDASYRRIAKLGQQVAARDRHPEYLAQALREALGADPKARPRALLHAALDKAASCLGAHPALTQLRSEIRILETSYD